MPHAMLRQPPRRDESPPQRPVSSPSHGGVDGQVDEQAHDVLPSCAAITAARSAVRAAPASRFTWGARVLQICDTPSSGMPASGPCCSVTSVMNRAVLLGPCLLGPRLLGPRLRD